MRLGTEREGTIITQTHKHYQSVMNGEKPQHSGYLIAIKLCIFMMLGRKRVPFRSPTTMDSRLAILFLMQPLCAAVNTTGGYPGVESVLSNAAGVLGVLSKGETCTIALHKRVLHQFYT